MKRTGILGIVIIFASRPLISESTSCLLPNKTAEIVDSCPESFNEMTKRAKGKNCEEQARTHSCTEIEQYKYHCVINELENALYDVCAKEYKIFYGACAEYHIELGIVQAHTGLYCTYGNPPCPTPYKSTEAYRYKYCYDAVKKNAFISTPELTTILNNTSSTQLTTNRSYISYPESTTTGSNNTTRQNNVTTYNDKENGTSYLAAIAALPISILLLALSVLIVIYRKKLPYIRGIFRRPKKRIDQRDMEELRNRDENIGEPRDKDENCALLKKGGKNLRNGDMEDPRDRDESFTFLKERRNNSKNGKEKKTCRKESYEDEIKSAQILLELMSRKGINIAEKLAEKQAQAEAFMDGNKLMRRTYVETRMLKACCESLNLNGIAILIGQQGCGKTLTAVHIMGSDQYTEWTKLMLTSWEDLLTIKVEEKSLVYIDNILDGFIYQDIVQKWFNSLCHFYFKQIRGGTDVHLLISCKQNVLKEALENIKNVSALDKILLKADMFPLSNVEKRKILKSQFDLAKELKDIDNPNPQLKFEFLELKKFVIGFPMCAHMYAFETQGCEKHEAIFNAPRGYVVRHIKNEITKDETNGVLTLFLILLFYKNQNQANVMRRLNIKYGDKCREYLEEMVSKEFVKKKNLKFDNLQERADTLKETVLVEFSKMFEFKHQIYKEGVVDYFFREDATFAIEYFPLDILRSYEFRDATGHIWGQIKERLMKELKTIQNIPMNEYEEKERHVAEVFSCKIFECRAFEKEFSMEFEKTLKNDYTLQEFLFNRKLHLSFWIGRYHLSTLLKTVMGLVYQFSDYQFYQALFGECCMKDKTFSVYLTSHMDLHKLKKRVFDFKSSSGQSIQHLILHSNKLDCDAHNTLVKVLKDGADLHVLQENDLLECSLEELSCSRLLCLLEILQGQNNLPTDRIVNLISKTIERMNMRDYSECLELEMLVRICILSVHYNITVLSAGAGICPNVNTKFNTVKKMLSGSEITISEKTNLIKSCIAKCQRTLNLQNDTPTNRQIPCIKNINLEFEEAVKAAIQLQEKAGY